MAPRSLRNPSCTVPCDFARFFSEKQGVIVCTTWGQRAFTRSYRVYGMVFFNLLLGQKTVRQIRKVRTAIKNSVLPVFNPYPMKTFVKLRESVSITANF
jgi:hypothetical protein